MDYDTQVTVDLRTMRPKSVRELRSNRPVVFDRQLPIFLPSICLPTEENQDQFKISFWRPQVLAFCPPRERPTQVG